MSSSESFGKLRAFLWPIHKSELRRFVPMFLIFFLICFNYSILRTTKDALLVTAPGSGAEAIPFIKVWAILPMALIFTLIFTRFSNYLTRERVFYWMMSLFLAFFFLFTFVLYPFQEQLHPHELADKLEQMLPVGFKGLIALIRNWTFTSFYVMSEMWSTMIMTVLFWGFANEVTSVKDAKRFYILFGLGANLATIFSGQICTLLSTQKFIPSLPFGSNAWDQSVVLITSIVLLSGFVSIGLFRWLHVKGLGYPSSTSTGNPSEKEGPSDVKMGLRKNFAYLAKSKYLLSIAVIVLMYNIAMTLIEVVWKDQMKQLYPNPSEFNAYMGQVVTWIGIVATVGAFISGAVIRRFNWSTSALIPPVILFVTGIAFFCFLLFENTPTFSFIAAALGTTPLVIGVFLGSTQNCFARASKYTLFDATKELAFIPLDKESKLKGKAAIDGIGSRLGKSGASIFHQGLLMLFGTVSLSAPYVALILLAAIVVWMVAVRALGLRFTQLTHQQAENEASSSVNPALANAPIASNNVVQ